MMEHPLAVLVSLITLATMLGGAVVSGIGYFVAKSDYRRDKAWHDVGHAKLRAERLTDEVDRYSVRELVEGKLPPVEQAEKKLFEKKQDVAQKALDELTKKAQDVSEVK